jgi:type II secretory pathway component PulM
VNELLERLITIWAGLAPRERILVGVALGLLGVVAVILVLAGYAAR